MENNKTELSKVNLKDEIVRSVIKTQLEALEKLPFDKGNMLSVEANDDKDNPKLPCSSMVQVYTPKKEIFQARRIDRGHGSYFDFWYCNKLPTVQDLMENINFDIVECNLIQGDTPISTIMFH